MTILKSIGAVVAGFLVVAVLSILTDYLLQDLGFYPQTGVYGPALLAVALVYRSIYTVVGGYVTAWLAPSNPMRHVVVLASIGLVLSIIGVVVGWSLGQQWYAILLALTAFPLTYWGGKIQTKQPVF